MEKNNKFNKMNKIIEPKQLEIMKKKQKNKLIIRKKTV